MAGRGKMRLTALAGSLLLGAGGLAGCGGATGASKVSMSVSPTVALWDQPRTIRLSHLHPRRRVTIRARTRLPDGIWGSSATFQANGDGIVDLARQAPVTGSYSGVSAMGLRWSESLVEKQAGPLNGKATTVFRASVGKHLVASADMTQILVGRGVTEHAERVGQTGFFGIYYAARAAVSRAPAVVLWGGSNGGLGDTPDFAALLASHGIPALALAYFDEPGLPCRLQNIPLGYFVRAIKWLRSRKQVDPERVWIIAASRGTEPELLVAAHFPALVHGLVAVSPTASVNGAFYGNCGTTGGTGVAPAWTLHGKPIPVGTPIPARRITANVLLMAGGADIVWASSTYAKELMTRLPRSGATHRYLYYPQAGHLVFGLPYTSVPASALRGGTIAADNAAWSSDWPITLELITHH